MVTWQITFDQIRNESSAASDLLAVMSIYDRQGVPDYLLQPEEQDDLDFEDALAPLLDFSLIDEQAQGQSFGMHRLVQLSMRKWLEAHDEQSKYLVEAMRTIINELPDGDIDARSTYEELLPHAKELLKHIPAGSDEVLQFCYITNETGWYLISKGEYALAEDLLQSALDIGSSELGRDHSIVLNIISNLAETYREQGFFIKAEELGRQLWETRKRVSGDEHPGTLNAPANLAATYSAQERFAEAEELEVQVLKIRQASGEEDEDTMLSMANLALIYCELNRMAEAEELAVQVLQMSKRILGEERPMTLIRTSNLASIWKDQGRPTAALELLQECSNLQRIVLGEDHPDTKCSSAALAD